MREWSCSCSLHLQCEPSSRFGDMERQGLQGGSRTSPHDLSATPPTTHTRPPIHTTAQLHTCRSHSSATCCRYIVKIDDDVYFRLDRLPHAIRQWSDIHAGEAGLRGSAGCRERAWCLLAGGILPCICSVAQCVNQQRVRCKHQRSACPTLAFRLRQMPLHACTSHRTPPHHTEPHHTTTPPLTPAFLCLSQTMWGA